MHKRPRTHFAARGDATIAFTQDSNPPLQVSGVPTAESRAAAHVPFPDAPLATPSNGARPLVSTNQRTSLFPRKKTNPGHGRPGFLTTVSYDSPRKVEVRADEIGKGIRR